MSTLIKSYLVPVYDIVGCGPRHRYVANGKLVHNSDKINMQNLPSRGTEAGKLKKCIEAPPGYIMIDCDSSNIEARMLAWLAGQDDLVDDFANGVDVYCKMASRIYGREISKKDPLERFLGKTVTLGCFGSDTQVLTESGWKRIVEVQLSDRLWDGQEWVNHNGLLNQGYRWVETPTDLMLNATGDHEILTAHGWREWSEVHSNPSLLRSALGEAHLPSLAGCNHLISTEKASDGTPSYAAIAGGKESPTEVTFSTNAPCSVTSALRKPLTKHGKNTGATQILSQIVGLEKACLTESRSVSLDASAQRTLDTTSTAGEESACILNGSKTENSFSDTSYLSTDGINSISNSTESTITKDTNPETLDGLHDQKTYLTVEKSTFCRQGSKLLKQRMLTYDIALSGPRNRFTVMTNKGPLIVHNCGYQTGAGKLQATLKQANPPMLLELPECERIINTYRDTYSMIPRLWSQGEVAIQAMHDDKAMWFGREGVVRIEGKRGVKLPSGLYIQYPQLHRVRSERGMQWMYKDTKGVTNIYGGKFTENIVQALARIVVMWQLLKIAKRYRVVLTVHDAVACLVPVGDVDKAIEYDPNKKCYVPVSKEAKEGVAYVEECMRWIPEWASGCPINCESGAGKTYGDC